MSKSDNGYRRTQRSRQVLDEYWHSKTGQSRAKRADLGVGKSIAEQLLETDALEWFWEDEAPIDCEMDYQDEIDDCWNSDWDEDWRELREDWDEIDVSWSWHKHLRPTREDMLCALGTCEWCDLCFPAR